MILAVATLQIEPIPLTVIDVVAENHINGAKNDTKGSLIPLQPFYFICYNEPTGVKHL